MTLGANSYRTAKRYRFHTFTRVERSIPQSVFAQAYADAAAWLEQNPNYDASTAIFKVAEPISDRTARLAALAFFDNFGCWCGDDEGVLMLCFAAQFARTDYLK